MIKAEIVADSKNEYGNRITTIKVTFPRFILAELNTHRMFSRNSASSRAIPFEKMLKSVEENPFTPIAWQKDHKGMQGMEYLDERSTEVATSAWKMAAVRAIDQAKYLSSRDVTKQLCNRLLEPFMWHTVLITATEWENFFSLRCPQYVIETLNNPFVFRSKKDYLKHCESLSGWEETKKDFATSTIQWLYRNKGQAEIHMMALAEAIWDAMNESIPRKLKAGEWHIPFGENILISGTNGIEQNTIDTIKISTARCARVSYTVVGEEDKVPNYENDIKLHDRLLEAGHMSPTEHCAKTMTAREICLDSKSSNGSSILEGWCGNFRGFIQYRKTIPNENRIAE